MNKTGLQSATPNPPESRFAQLVAKFDRFAAAGEASESSIGAPPPRAGNASDAPTESATPTSVGSETTRKVLAPTVPEHTDGFEGARGAERSVTKTAPTPPATPQSAPQHPEPALKAASTPALGLATRAAPKSASGSALTSASVPALPKSSALSSKAPPNPAAHCLPMLRYELGSTMSVLPSVPQPGEEPLDASKRPPSRANWPLNSELARIYLDRSNAWKAIPLLLTGACDPSRAPGVIVPGYDEKLGRDGTGEGHWCQVEDASGELTSQWYTLANMAAGPVHTLRGIISCFGTDADASPRERLAELYHPLFATTCRYFLRTSMGTPNLPTAALRIPLYKAIKAAKEAVATEEAVDAAAPAAALRAIAAEPSFAALLRQQVGRYLYGAFNIVGLGRYFPADFPWDNPDPSLSLVDLMNDDIDRRAAEDLKSLVLEWHDEAVSRVDEATAGETEALPSPQDEATIARLQAILNANWPNWKSE